MDKIRCNLKDLLICLSNAQDLVSPVLSNHNQQVAYLSFRLCEQIGLPLKTQRNVFLAAFVHDIGALSDDNVTVIEGPPHASNLQALKGALLLQDFKPLRTFASLVKYHNIPWNNGEGAHYNENTVPIYSHIIHLANWFCERIKLPNNNILSQLPELAAFINQNNNSIFVPRFVRAMNELIKKEYIWLDLISPDPIKRLPDCGLSETITLDINDTIDFAMFFSRIIDCRSRFTACHSAGVANVAEHMARLAGFSRIECKMMLIAGYLHDLGKLAIPNTILEKEGQLDVDEFKQIRTHSYYTYALLNHIPQFDVIKIWAAFHHERLDGNGYPFHVSGDNIPLGARIMAIADIFTALTEDRPYRKAMTSDRVMRILDDMVANGAIDARIVTLLKNNYDVINLTKEKSQNDIRVTYKIS